MRIPTSRYRTGFDANATMTPMIDIVFQLLIFFICASTGTVRDLLLQTDLAPGAVEAAVSPPAEKPLGEVWLKLERRGEATVSVLEGADYPEFGPLLEVLRAGRDREGTARESGHRPGSSDGGRDPRLRRLQSGGI